MKVEIITLETNRKKADLERQKKIMFTLVCGV